MSSRIWRSTAKVAASSVSTFWGAVVATGICRILAMSDSEIGFADLRLLQQVGRQALRHEPALLQHIGAVRDVERFQHVLLDQQDGRAPVSYTHLRAHETPE